ncbi:MAG TPA: IclR family transcriptional regulator C-terminal domain-containing protein [Casimicrobiaceae bacterium]|nr:IclR family transcriptional regulator C-terminal domain-containing protein [Casimicrobiaceae bacterium]
MPPRIEGGGSGTTAGHAQALARGLALLETLAATDAGATLTALAAALGLPTPTAHRLLAALGQAGFVEQDDHGVWRIGVRAFRVGSAFLEQRNLTAQTLPRLHQLMEQSGETANLAVPSEGEVVFIAQVQCRELMRMSVKLGARAPMHASGAGKAILSALDPRGLDREIGRMGLARYTDNTIVERDALQAELRASRERGYAVDDEEHARGLRCVAAPILDEHGQPWAALSLAGPTGRLTPARVAALGALVAAAARDVTAALGGRAAPAAATTR